MLRKKRADKFSKQHVWGIRENNTDNSRNYEVILQQYRGVSVWMSLKRWNPALFTLTSRNVAA